MSETKKEVVEYIKVKSQFIEDYQEAIINDCTITYSNLQSGLTEDTTWDYPVYNFFAASSPSPYLYRIYEELRFLVREQIPTSERVWVQSWLNYHKQNKILDWHNHTFPLHGYICIDPKDTVTEFENWTIENEVGTIYLGPGDAKHRVVANSKYDGPRITIGFDIVTETSLAGELAPSMNFGAMPLL